MFSKKNYSMIFIYELVLSLFCFLDGVDSTKEKLFIVKIEVIGRDSNCAGSIITKKSVLTAAHCVNAKPSDISVIHFTPKRANIYKVNQTYLHPEYDSFTLSNDAAILEIQGGFREPWTPIVLNDVRLKDRLNYYNNCKMLGWLMRDNILLLKSENKESKLSNSSDLFIFENSAVRITRVPVSLINAAECSRKIKNFGGSFTGEKNLCGISKNYEPSDLCSIGSGGPLLCSVTAKTPTDPYPKNPVERKLEYETVKYLGLNSTLEDPLDLFAPFRVQRYVGQEDEYQLAVVSWGKICSNVPSLFVRTDCYYEWIKSIISNFDNQTHFTYTSVFGTTSKSATTVETFYIYLSVLYPITISNIYILDSIFK